MGDFGAQLREARERKGISLRQIAASTKISVAALEGLERNDISRLPGGIFSRSFVRSYAIEVGLDPDETVRQFLDRFSDENPGVAPVSQASAPARTAPPLSRNLRVTDAAAIRPSASHANAPGPTEEVDFESKQRMAGVVLKLALVSLPIAAAIIYFGSRGAAVPPGASGAVRPDAADSQHAGPSPHETSATPLQTSPDVTTESDSAPGPLAPAVSAPEVAVQPESGALRLEIAPTSPCWVELTVDGELAVSRVIAAGELESRDFRDSAVLQVGDAAACAVSIDGRPLRPLGGPKQVRKVRVTRDNYRRFLR